MEGAERQVIFDEGGRQNKIQAIYNGKNAAITMQGLARMKEKPLAQEQWISMEKQCQEQWKQ
jgi:hypothetical protein